MLIENREAHNKVHIKFMTGRRRGIHVDIMYGWVCIDHRFECKDMRFTDDLALFASFLFRTSNNICAIMSCSYLPIYPLDDNPKYIEINNITNISSTKTADTTDGVLFLYTCIYDMSVCVFVCGVSFFLKLCTSSLFTSNSSFISKTFLHTESLRSRNSVA